MVKQYINMEIKETTYKGTRILFGKDAYSKLDMIRALQGLAKVHGYSPIIFPVIQKEEYFNNKVGEENNNMMFTFKDRGNRNLCLAPEYTAIAQELAKTTFKQQKDVKLFYCQETFRGEKPQAGRYRQFTQFGIEILNPTKDYTIELSEIALSMIELVYIKNDLELNFEVTRGLDYYNDGKGFEIINNKLGSAKQLCGGGSYEGGIGFAIGVDRLLL